MRREFGKHFLNLGLLFIGTFVFQHLLTGQTHLWYIVAGVAGYVCSLVIAGCLLKGGD